jgi:predicted RNA-binding Zn-ribbon protein involved in translation (DUF1610 family)
MDESIYSHKSDELNKTSIAVNSVGRSDASINGGSACDSANSRAISSDGGSAGGSDSSNNASGSAIIRDYSGNSGSVGGDSAGVSAINNPDGNAGSNSNTGSNSNAGSNSNTGSNTIDATGNENTKPVVDVRTGIPYVNPDIEIEKALQMRETFNKLFSTLLQQGIDFDRIPGTDKPTLLKPGADLLCQVFHFASGEPKLLSSIENLEKGIFSYTVSVPIIHRDTQILVSTGIGSANSYEVKYKYRYVDSEEGEKVRVINPDPADQQNTLVKMAAKRAYIDGVLKATGASRMFTQDIEDMTWLTPEKASSKQINYIRMLYGKVEESEMLESISNVIDRKVESLDEIYREEASKIIEERKKWVQQYKQTGNKNTPVEKGNNFLCQKCGTRITQGVAAYSRRNYGKFLCERCQKTEVRHLASSEH